MAFRRTARTWWGRARHLRYGLSSLGYSEPRWEYHSLAKVSINLERPVTIPRHPTCLLKTTCPKSWLSADLRNLLPRSCFLSANEAHINREPDNFNDLAEGWG